MRQNPFFLGSNISLEIIQSRRYSLQTSSLRSYWYQDQHYNLLHTLPPSDETYYRSDVVDSSGFHDKCLTGTGAINELSLS